MQDKQNPQYEEYNATLDPDPIAEKSDDELQDSILEDSNLNGFQRYIAKLDDAKWALVQRIAGSIMGILAGVALFWKTNTEQQGIFSIPLLIALMIALVLPNIIEKQGLRRAPKLRIAMVIALAAVLVVYFAFNVIQGGFAPKA